jgi:hypothetical protein
MEVLRKEDRSPAEPTSSGGLVPGQTAFDPALKQRLRDVVMEVLTEHLRQLERRGML